MDQLDGSRLEAFQDLFSPSDNLRYLEIWNFEVNVHRVKHNMFIQLTISRTLEEILLDTVSLKRVNHLLGSSTGYESPQKSTMCHFLIETGRITTVSTKRPKD